MHQDEEKRYLDRVRKEGHKGQSTLARARKAAKTAPGRDRRVSSERIVVMALLQQQTQVTDAAYSYRRHKTEGLAVIAEGRGQGQRLVWGASMETIGIVAEVTTLPVDNKCESM